MEPPHLEEELSAYLANELSPDERDAVEQHLNGCSRCSEKLNQLRRLDEVLGGAKPLEPSLDFVGRVNQQIDQDNKVIRYRSRRTIVWLALAAALAFAVLVLKLQNHVKPPPGITHHKVVPHAPYRVKPSIPKEAHNTKSGSPEVPKEDVELIANLDALEDMDLISNYENIEQMELAVLSGDEERSE